jgi:hypothetical protein
LVLDPFYYLIILFRLGSTFSKVALKPKLAPSSFVVELNSLWKKLNDPFTMPS